MSASNDFYYINILNDIVAGLYKYILPILFVLGNVGNLLTALVFWRKAWRKNVCVFYFKVYLLSNTCYINSSLLGSIFTLGFSIHVQNSSEVLCKVFFYAAYLFAIHSPTILILASIDRLLISSQNVDTRLYSSKRLAYFSVSLATIFWVIFNFHILIKVHIQELFPSVFICFYDVTISYRNFVSYYLAIVNLCYSVIMIVLCSISLKNVRHISIVPRQQRGQGRAMTKKDFQLLRCLFAHGVIYIVFRLGINMFYAYEAITRVNPRSPTHSAIDLLLNNFLSFLFNASYCLSFLVYVSISKAFRHELKRIVYKMCGGELQPMREEENRVEKIDMDEVIAAT